MSVIAEAQICFFLPVHVLDRARLESHSERIPRLLWQAAGLASGLKASKEITVLFT